MSDAPVRLRLVSDAPPATELGLADEIRATRRGAARFLRALHASGHAIASWPDALVSRLAHADAVTARFLLEPQRVDPEHAIAAAAALRSIESWITDGLSGSERAKLRACELATRIEPDELALPLLQLERAVADEPALVPPRGPARGGTLRAVLAALDDVALGEIGRRLGLARRVEVGTRHLAVVALHDEGDGTAPPRRALEHDIARVLRDEHLLGILVATLSGEALGLLAALCRGNASAERLHAPALAVGGGPRQVGPGDALVQCALAHSVQGELAVVPELRVRLDAVLQSLGI